MGFTFLKLKNGPFLLEIVLLESLQPYYFSRIYYFPSFIIVIKTKILPISRLLASPNH